MCLNDIIKKKKKEEKLWKGLNLQEFKKRRSL